MRRASFMVILLAVLVSLLLLSALSDILTGYSERSLLNENQKKQAERDTAANTEEEQSILLFKVSPAAPQLFWRVSTADYYTGLYWLRTTDEKVLEEFPQFQDPGATEVFTVEIDTGLRERFLPLASPNATVEIVSLALTGGLKFYRDVVGNTYKVMMHGQTKEMPLVYRVSWRDVEVDDRFVSLDSIPEEISDTYLQLPNIPIEVSKLAKSLEHSSYSTLDQVLADVQYLKTNFVYDMEHSQDLYEGFTQGSDIHSYIERRKGICIDAATALAVILRIQGIPARMSIGYKPGRIEGDKLLFYTTGAHAVTEVYLPPYGWIQFDATPPLEENPLVRVSPFKKEATLGDRLYYHLLITNRRKTTDNFKLFVDSKQKWNIEAAPEELSIEALQTADAMIAVTIPDNASFGEKDLVTVAVVSLNNPKIAFSTWVIIQVEDVPYISTTTTLRNVDEAVIRGDTFWVNGTVASASDEQVDNMTILVFLTRSGEAEGIIIGKGYSKQGNFLIESAVPYFMEVGDYKVISISLGTTQYAPSSSESIIRLRATTRMTFSSKEEFLLGYGAINGRLLWDNGTGFSEAPISLKITSLAAPSDVWELQNLTCKDGFFRIETRFETSRIFEIEAIYSGNEYVAGSNATHIIELKTGLPEIRIFGENTAVRGEVFNITGAVQFEDTGVWGEPVTVTFDNQPLATLETRDNGSYACSFLVDSEQKLGSHIFTVTLETGDISAVHKVVVKSKTTLTAKASDIAGGMFFLFSASLFDDHGQPIRGAEITIDDYDLSWKTDRNGNLTFLLDTVRLWPESILLTARFEGSELYQPATTENEAVLEPVISLLFLIPLVSPASAVMVFVYVKHYVTKRRIYRQTAEVEIEEEKAIVEKGSRYRLQEKQLLEIVLPDIEAQFPNVWSAWDKLRIEVVLDKNAREVGKEEVKILIDDETIASVELSRQGRAGLHYMFTKKGEYKVRAILPRTFGGQPWSAEIRLRIVDYGEETIRLYNEFLVRLPSHGIAAHDIMTAREIENLILRKCNPNPRALGKVTAGFEKAEYSNRLTTRGDYEEMYLSLKELNIHVE